MELKPIAEILQNNNLGKPQLNALIPNVNNYKTFLLQPHGEIEANSEGVFNKNKEIAKQQFSSFLNEALKNDSDLVITPEYSLPWEVLIDSLNNEIKPKEGKIWVLGCESIKYSQLAEISHRISAKAKLLHEPLEADNDRYVDPLAYIFTAPSLIAGEGSKLVVVIQFKTHPMGDNDHFEINGLQLGNHIYKFGGDAGQLSLISFICSDAFNINDAHANEIYDRSLIIHIQLNPSPRHTQYRQYRDKLFNYANDETELICVNWASNVHEWQGEACKQWMNISGSAWYSKSLKIDIRDNLLRDNHKKGLYYTWCKPLMTNVLFFNYAAGAYLLEATKVAHIGVPAAVSRRRGPQMSAVFLWDKAEESWVEKESLDDGFSGLIPESGNAKDELYRISKSCPIEVERILALSEGNFDEYEEWYLVRKLDSFGIGLNEVVYRITFCQDTDKTASSFRISRLRKCGALWEILKDDANLPQALADFKDGFNFKWSEDKPHQNAISSSGKSATLIYMGEGYSKAKIESTTKNMSEMLSRSFSNPDDSHSAKQRLAVWYRDLTGKINQFNPDKFIRYDDPGSNSEFDLGRED